MPQPLGPFLIGERVGAQVWLAEDTRNGKTVALKLLSKMLPKDQAKRDTLLREVRVAGALYHAFLVPIVEILIVGDNLLMVMEQVEGQPLSKMIRGSALAREQTLQIGYQLVDALKYLHTKGLLHGNINTDAVLVTPAGQVKLGGINLGNLQRRDQPSTAYQQKGSDIRSVAYMSPEQIVGQFVDEKSDIFSCGAVMYEMATGRPPFMGKTAPDVARAVVEGNPPSPTSLNPSLDKPVVTILGGCLFKDQFQRYPTAKQLLDAIARANPNVVTFAQRLEKRIVTTTASETESRRSLLFIADVAGTFEDDAAAAKAAAKMQQVLGEAVYLFDGTVIDPFSRRMIAELPNVEAAREAGRKGEFDLSPERQDGTSPPIAARMLLHAGEVEVRDAEASGAALEKAFEALVQLPPNTLFISEEFVKEGRGNVRLRDAGARAGVKLFTIVPAEPPAVEVPEPTTIELEEEEAAEQAAMLAAVAEVRRKRTRSIAIAAAALLVFLTVAGVMWLRRPAEEPAPVVAVSKPVGPQPATAANPRAIVVADFTVEDPALQERATAIRLGAIEVLRSYPEIRVTEGESEDDATPFSARLRNGAAGPELVPTSGANAGAPVAAPDAASGIAALVGWVTSNVKGQPHAIAAADAMNAFGDALVAREKKDETRADASLRAALTADPNFLPAQLLAMKFYESRGNVAQSIAAARRVVALDPSQAAAARKVAHASLIAGDLAEAFSMYGAVLRREPRDVEALNQIARYAVSVADNATFQAAIGRMRGVPPELIVAHEPDLLAAAGRLDAATQRYYDVETAVPNNPALALKIGRMAVLRHSLEIAEIERKKLADLDPLYGLHMLQAYIAAEQRDRVTAERELKTALAASRPGDDAWTSAAEVYAILADTRGVLDALEKAAARKEPTSSYVLANPLFRYLQSDARFEKVRASLTAQQQEVRAALARTFL
jgi:tetratricopeptide (TPR) repeat protein